MDSGPTCSAAMAKASSALDVDFARDFWKDLEEAEEDELGFDFDFEDFGPEAPSNGRPWACRPGIVLFYFYFQGEGSSFLVLVFFLGGVVV